MVENSPFDERTLHIIAKSKMPVGILVDKNLEKLNQVFMPIFTPEDAFLIDYAQKLIINNDSHITFIDPNDAIWNNKEVYGKIDFIEMQTSNYISVQEDRIMKKDFLGQMDIMINSLESWKKLVNSQSTWLSNITSVLIIKP